LKVLSQKEPGDPPPTEDDFRQMEKEDEEGKCTQSYVYNFVCICSKDWQLELCNLF